MPSFQKQKNSWNQYLRERRYKISAFGLKPETDWKILLSLTVIAALFVSIGGFIMYEGVLNTSEEKFDIFIKRLRIVEVEDVDKRMEFFESQRAELNSMLGRNIVPAKVNPAVEEVEG